MSKLPNFTGEAGLTLAMELLLLNLTIGPGCVLSLMTARFPVMSSNGWPVQKVAADFIIHSVSTYISVP